MTVVSKDIEVNVPISTAYNQWTQFEEFPEFMKGVDSISQNTEAKLHWKTSIVGVTREFDTVITKQDPDSAIAWKSTTGPDHTGEVTFEELDANTCRVSVEFNWEPDGMVEKLGSALSFDDATVEGDLKRFKDFIEARGVETGAYRKPLGDAAPPASSATSTFDSTPTFAATGAASSAGYASNLDAPTRDEDRGFSADEYGANDSLAGTQYDDNASASPTAHVNDATYTTSADTTPADTNSTTSDTSYTATQ